MEGTVTGKAKHPFEVLYLDDHVIAVNKSAGIPVVPLRTGKGPSLRGLLAEQLGAERLYVVHRIDKDTSGVVLFARDRNTHRAVSMMFQNREIRKTYVAVVCGRPVPAEGTIELPLRQDKHHHERTVVARKKGKPSHTDYRTLEVFRGYTLVELKPLTGRMHQLRVHMAAIGYPLAVDTLYGGADAVYLSEFKRGYRRKKDRLERPLISRLSLHARDVRLKHPVTGAVTLIEAPLPRDLTVFLKQLSKYAAVAPDER